MILRATLTYASPTMLVLALAACGGASDGGSALASSKNEPIAAIAKAEVAAAASAAASESVTPEIAARVKTNAVRDDSHIDQFVVKYKDGSVERANATEVERKLDRLAIALPSKARHRRRMGIGADVITTDRKLNAKDAKAFMRAVASDPNVEYVEPDTELSAMMVPNDPEYARQWFYQSNLSLGANTGIRQEAAWDVTLGGGQVIAIVDNGVTSHSDYNANLLGGVDIGDFTYPAAGMNPGLPGSNCVNWHATHVAGIAVAQTNNGVGVAGVAPGAKMLSVRTLTACGNGSMSAIADGITWASGGTIPGRPVNANPATVINLSLGGNNPCQTTLQNAIDFATSKGAIVVAAAGNESMDVSRLQPANCHNVIAVGGTNASGGSYLSSNFGSGIDISAPATDIWSLYNSGTTVPTSEGYSYMSGTSMATPMVSGAIALAKSVAPIPLTVAEYRTILQQNAQPFPVKLDRNLGAGILDVARTVVSAKTGSIPVAADFTCQTENTDYNWVRCQDLSTARGDSVIKNRNWDFGSSFAQSEYKNPDNFRYKYGGTYPVTLSVTDSNGKISKLTRSVQVSTLLSIDLQFDTPVQFSGKYSTQVFYKVIVPEGAKSLTFSLNMIHDGEAASIYINDAPSDMFPLCIQNFPGPKNFSCTIASPKAGAWYGRYYISSPSLSGATITASVT
ncbi:S8 family serine peptidase [Paraburkholderia bannensis]|uniref:S8 family serine peptidase n=1 Tax=Paraburkholderia bannensis TaxID=765414 RepID=UPI002AC35104|nr:S8 family serine peptidase [Paraburkholderia bannensis]